MIVDLILAVARRTAEFSAFATLLSVRLADPRAERSDQFGAVRPQINVVAGVRAKLASRTVILAHAARFAGYVRQTQTARIVSTVKQRSVTDYKRTSIGAREIARGTS